MKKITKNIIMFILGCCFYVGLEIVYRNQSYRLMFVSGGVIFLFGNLLNNKFGWKMDLLLQSGIISIATTLLEAIVGNIDYYFLRLNMWDYSTLPLNYLNGKVCLPFTIIWFLLGFAVVIIGDAIEYYWLHDDEQPEYWIFGERIWQMPKRKCDFNG